MHLFPRKYVNVTVLLVSFAALIGSVLVIYAPVLEHTGGVISYPLDDSYIHLAIAKNLAENHVWGISPHEFSSASSSIIYPLLLAGLFMLGGVHVGIPLFLNIVASMVFLWVVQRWLIRQGISPAKQLLILLIAIFLIPLPPLVQVGMEHTLQLLFYFLFVYSFADALESRERPIRWKVYAYGALFVATRYESLAVIAIACLFLLYYRKWVPAFLLGAISFLPVLIFGLYSLSKGSDFLPNSVSLKSGIPPLTFDGLYTYFTGIFGYRLFLSAAGYLLTATQRLLFLLPLSFLLFSKQKPAYQYILIILMGGSLFHISTMIFWFGSPRYEAALIGCSVIICATLLMKYTPIDMARPLSGSGWIKVLVGCYIVAPLFLRAWNGFERSSLAAISIYDQQVQMGHFVHEYYDQSPIVFQDIGAVSYFAHGNNLDLMGLGNVTVARRIKKHQDTPEFFDSLIHLQRAKIAIAFEPMYHDLRQHWTKIASWTIPYNNVSAYNSVFFYAIDSSEAPRLTNSLKQYKKSLPAGVIVKYYYPED